MTDNTYTNKEIVEGLEEITNMIGRFMGVLMANGTIDLTDMNYITGKMSESDYTKHFTESRDLGNLIHQMFNMTTPESKPDNDKETT